MIDKVGIGFIAMVALAACSEPTATGLSDPSGAPGASSTPGGATAASAAATASAATSIAAATASATAAPADPNVPSADPTAEEWKAAPEGYLRDVTESCRAKVVREWVRIVCRVGNDPTCSDDGDRKVNFALGLGKGPLKAKVARDEHDASLVFRLVEGVELKAALQCKFPYPVLSRWTAGKPKPAPIAKIMGGSEIGSSCLSEIDCGAAGMCHDSARLTDKDSVGRATCVAKDY